MDAGADMSKPASIGVRQTALYHKSASRDEFGKVEIY